MPIRVTCQNCGKKFSAWDDLVGKPVQCPKCQQQMIVPGPDGTPAGVPPEEDIFFSDAAASQSPPSAPPAARGAQTPRRTVKLSNPQAAQPPRGTTTPPPVVNPPAPPVAPTAAAGPEEDNADDLTLPCPKCNAAMPLNEDLCDACGYHRVLKKVLDTSDVYKPTAGTGFEKMISGQIAEFESAEGALFWAKIVAVVLLALVAIVCFRFWGLLVVAAVVGTYFTWAWHVKKNAGENETFINRDPLGVAVWQTILFLQRAVGWRIPQWPFPKTRVLSMHDPSFGDADLAELKGLEEFETLDFEGSEITDAGLAHFESLKKLRFLVLKRTGVTPDGVRRLQHRRQKAWIWY
jgi:hypothetical protein